MLVRMSECMFTFMLIIEFVCMSYVLCCIYMLTVFSYACDFRCFAFVIDMRMCGVVFVCCFFVVYATGCWCHISMDACVICEVVLYTCVFFFRLHIHFVLRAYVLSIVYDGIREREDTEHQPHVLGMYFRDM